MILASLATKFLFARLASLATNLSARLARSKSCYEISFCETRKKRFSLRNFVTRLAFRYSRYEISVCETHEKRVSLLIFDSRVSRKSRENFGSKKRVSLLARISKSDSRVNHTCIAGKLKLSVMRLPQSKNKDINIAQF